MTIRFANDGRTIRSTAFCALAYLEAILPSIPPKKELASIGDVPTGPNPADVPLEISPETTWLTSQKTADGKGVDYFAWAENRVSKSAKADANVVYRLLRDVEIDRNVCLCSGELYWKYSISSARTSREYRFVTCDDVSLYRPNAERRF